MDGRTVNRRTKDSRWTNVKGVSVRRKGAKKTTKKKTISNGIRGKRASRASNENYQHVVATVQQ